MDLLSASSGGGGRILATRHISADKAIPHANNHINTTVLCHSYSVQPDFYTYFSALQGYAWVLWSIELVVLLGICLLYAITLKSAFKHWRHNIENVAVVLAVYPVVAAVAFLATILPKARLLCEAIAQEAVMVAIYYFFCTVIADFGGFDQLERRAAGVARLETRVLPCCCWPCCLIPRPNIKKRNLKWLRYLVLQLPVVQGIIYILILTLWAESMVLYQSCFVFIQPFIIVSILSGVWGIIMTVRTVGIMSYNARPRFFAVQLTLIIVKLQSGFAKVLPEIFDLPCILPLNPSVFVNMINNSLMMLEMLLLAIVAWKLYSSPGGKDITTQHNKLPQVVVAVLEDSSRSLEKDGIENKSYNNNRNIE